MLICAGSRKFLKSCFQCRSLSASDFNSDTREFALSKPRNTSWTYSKAAYCRILVGISFVDVRSPSICCLNFLGCIVAHDNSLNSLIWLQIPESAVHTAFKSRNSSNTGSSRVWRVNSRSSASFARQTRSYSSCTRLSFPSKMLIVLMALSARILPWTGRVCSHSWSMSLILFSTILSSATIFNWSPARDRVPLQALYKTNKYMASYRAVLG